MSELARKSLAEAVGTFALVFLGCGAIVVDAEIGGGIGHVGISLVFGLVVAAMIYALGDVSGAHLNPAVTLGFRLAGRLPSRAIAPYVLGQLAGALAAALLLRLLFPEAGTSGETRPRGGVGQSLVLEVVLTAVLMLTILRVSTGAKEKGVIAGIAVGAVVALAALTGGPISGASMNPARSLGPALVGAGVAEQWIYLVGPGLGAALAVLLDRGIGSAEAVSRGTREPGTASRAQEEGDRRPLFDVCVLVWVKTRDTRASGALRPPP